MTFDGAKVAVFLGDELLVMRRDTGGHVVWPGALDWPGGGREGDETPEETALRETREEVGLSLSVADLVPGDTTEFLGVRVVKFSARLAPERWADVKLGDEGQAIGRMSPRAFLDHGDAVPSLVAFLRHDLGHGWEDTRPRVGCRTPAKGRDGVTNIPAWKYDLMRMWLRELVHRAGDEGLPFKGLADRIAPLLHDEERARLGSVGWHMTSVKLEMEVRGELARMPGPGPQRIVAGQAFDQVVTGGVP